MDRSYSLHSRIPKVVPVKKKRRKRKFTYVETRTHESYQYNCYHCGNDVYFLPGHELVCTDCHGRIVTKPGLTTKRMVDAR
jgi:DNA-directed RNA polymerase subunit RPC12/RpoP